MKTEIKKVESFNLKINEKDFGDFKKTSEWEGFKKLENHRGECVIISHENDFFSEFFDIGEYKLIKASPDISAALKDKRL